MGVSAASKVKRRILWQQNGKDLGIFCLVYMHAYFIDMLKMTTYSDMINRS